MARAGTGAYDQVSATEIRTRRGTTVRYVAMQLLTWGTIAGAVGSALLLAALDSPLERQLAALPRADLFVLPSAPTGAARPNQMPSARASTEGRPTSEPAPRRDR